MQITKANGELAPFQVKKLAFSLKKAGAAALTIQQIVSSISSILYEGISTKEIYKKAFMLLRKYSRPTAARYKLKKAIMELGPTGYPFENFIGKILEYEGFKTEVGVVMQGHCVTHEVDVTALKENEHYLVECKFHTDQGATCNVKIPLYIQSRFKDLETQWLKRKDHSTKFHKGWVYTNTRFTTDAIQYGECAGLGLVSWDYPPHNNLKSRIDSSGLHPITCLTSLTKKEKQDLLNKGVVLCKEIRNKPSFLEAVGIKAIKQKSILKEANELCKN